MLRWGRVHRGLSAGLCWTLPLVEEVLRTDVRETTDAAAVQGVTTKRGTWHVSAVATWHVEDAEAYLLNCYDGENVVLDSLTGAVTEVLCAWDGKTELTDVAHEACKKANRAAKRWGVRFDRVRFKDWAKGPAVRLLQG